MQHDTTTLLEGLRHITSQNIAIALSFETIPTQQLHWKPMPTKWSILECLEHLNAYSRYYLPVLASAITSNKYPPSSHYKSTWLGVLCIRSVQMDKRQKTAFKMKAFSDYDPSRYSFDPSNTLPEFLQHQRVTLDLLDLAQRGNLGKVQIPISIAKWLRLNLGDALQFLIYHNERHVAQALRNEVLRKSSLEDEITSCMNVDNI